MKFELSVLTWSGRRVNYHEVSFIKQMARLLALYNKLPLVSHSKISIFYFICINIRKYKKTFENDNRNQN